LRSVVDFAAPDKADLLRLLALRAVGVLKLPPAMIADTAQG
jgi:hypothetical protein